MLRPLSRSDALDLLSVMAASRPGGRQAQV